jgi:AraC family transcriptional regulator of arabinose operon
MIWFARDRSTQHGWLEFVEPRFSPELQRRLEMLPFSSVVSDRVAALFASLIGLADCARAARAEIQYAAALQLFWEAIASVEDASRDGVRSSVVARAEQFIEAHLGEPVTLEQVAFAVGVSKAHLGRLFQHERGRTPIAFLWDRRVERAIALLKHTGLNVQEIAQRCGFRSAYHFSRRVKQRTGRSPSELRES